MVGPRRRAASLITAIRCADQVGFSVPDLDAATTFFVDVLGATERERFAVDDSPELMEHGLGVRAGTPPRAVMPRLTPALCVTARTQAAAGLFRTSCGRS